MDVGSISVSSSVSASSGIVSRDIIMIRKQEAKKLHSVLSVISYLLEPGRENALLVFLTVLYLRTELSNLCVNHMLRTRSSRC